MLAFHVSAVLEMVIHRYSVVLTNQSDLLPTITFYFFSAIARGRRDKRGRRPRYNPLPNGEIPSTRRRNRTNYNSDIVPRQPWAPPREDYRSGAEVVDREPEVFYRDPNCPGCAAVASTDSEAIPFQRDIPQASSSNRRQCEYFELF